MHPIDIPRKYVATLVNMMQFFADVLTTEELERLIARSAGPIPTGVPDSAGTPVPVRTSPNLNEHGSQFDDQLLPEGRVRAALAARP